MNQEESYVKKEILKNGTQLTLRKAIPEDAEGMIKYLNIVGGESDNLLFGKDEFYFTTEEEADYIRRLNENPEVYMIIGLIGGTIASVAQISCPASKRICHNSEIAISVLKEFWGNGVGTAVMEELLRYAKENPRIKNVSLGVRADNIKAIKLYEKFGFQKSGIHKDYFHINASYYDEILMDLYL